ncbi:hypothetical protein [Shewanella sp. 38A_GOM-205m]|uniref:hypothetical protein n=1 Tax=Shewanella sp. 38A_GOM-205m TaxID=1380363 RepID=UPI0004914492|nr:hypothetical protein [Shewanella sp. 38A_GOM-205m]
MNKKQTACSQNATNNNLSPTPTSRKSTSSSQNHPDSRPNAQPKRNHKSIETYRSSKERTTRKEKNSSDSEKLDDTEIPNGLTNLAQERQIKKQAKSPKPTEQKIKREHLDGEKQAHRNTNVTKKQRTKLCAKDCKEGNEKTNNHPKTAKTRSNNRKPPKPGLSNRPKDAEPGHKTVMNRSNPALQQKNPAHGRSQQQSNLRKKQRNSKTRTDNSNSKKRNEAEQPRGQDKAQNRNTPKQHTQPTNKPKSP